jgi:fucose 4-O-acetylase-like acetyltransferase
VKEASTGKMDSWLSTKINCARLIYSIFIVFFHAENIIYYQLNKGPISNKVAMYIEKVINVSGYSIAIPSFFAISGYLFYRGFSMGKISYKYKRCVTGLIVPYLFWNVVFAVIWAMIEPDAVWWTKSNILRIVLYTKYSFFIYASHDLCF